jgi:pSer/pThr/pTyr-binding forkhead associated (FHA) protein
VENPADSSSTPAYLFLDGETVYEIAPNSVMNMGRLVTNDVILDDYKVSREHAVLKYGGGEFVLVDLASTHGTFVNGERVDRKAVQFGDKIQITSHEMVLSREIPVTGSDQRPIQSPKSSRTLDRRLKFFGGLNEFSLMTLVQFLCQEKQSGLLLLELGQTPGPHLFFVDGEIIHVSEGENLAELLTTENHDPSLFFYFHHETNFPPRTIQGATTNYLMNLCQSYDESKGEKVTAAAMGRSTGPLAVTARLDFPDSRT